MRWDQEWGAHVEMLENRAARGLKTPALDRRPAIKAEWTDAWNAFAQLHAMRSIGMSENPITAADIDAYFRMFDVTDVEQRQDWFVLICALDRAYLSSRSEGKGADSPSSD